MSKRAKGCFECKELNDVLYRCRYGGENTWIFLCEYCLSFVKKKYQAGYRYGGTWKKQKEMMRNFVIFILFVWAIMIIGYLAGWIAYPPILVLMEIFF